MALSADRQVERYDGEIIALTVKTGKTVYKGGLVSVDNTGYALPAANAASTVFMGVAMEGGAAGQTVRVYRRGIFNFVAADMAVTDMGARVYVSDDTTVTKTVGNGVYVGKIVRVASATSVWVDLESGAPAIGTIYDRSVLSIPIKLKNLANGDVVTEYIPGFAGMIEKVSFVVTDKATTADKTAKLNLEIETTNVTGGEITLSSAAGGNALTMGKVTDGSAITAANVFTETQKISVEASSVTAFVEGEGVLLIVLKHATAAA